MGKYIVLGVAVLILLIGVGSYNSFVGLDQSAVKAIADVNTTLQRRYDLLPNLVEVVQSYAKHERKTFTAVAEARAKVGQFTVTPELLADPSRLALFRQSQGELSSALTRLMAVVEQYPQLKADARFADLQTQLEGTENRIAVARERYNRAVQDYNTSTKRFPGVVVASVFGFKEKVPFELEDQEAKKAPKVKINID